MKKLIALVSSLLLVFGFLIPPVAFAQGQHKDIAFDSELKAVAKKTWKFFEDHTDPVTHLPVDEVRYGDEAKVGSHTSPTNIAMYMVSTISAEKLGFISRDEAVERIKNTLTTLERMQKWNGLFYNWYYTKDATLKTDWGQFVSTVDNGWLSAGLVVVRQAYPELSEQAGKLFEAMDYSLLYDPVVGQMHGGYDAVAGQLTGWHFGMFNTEPRMASYIAIGKGDVPKEHWWRMYRTLPADWTWQGQIPQGHTETYDGIEVFEGHYEHNGIKYVPSWGGSMFEALMPTLFLKEKDLAPQGLGLNDQRHVELQQLFAKEKGYPAWGFSPSAIPGGYTEFGVKYLGTAGYKDDGTVTPHASFLALEFAPEAVRENLKVLKDFGAYGKYGFSDSVNVLTGKVTPAYLALDQGMIMIAITNYLKDGIIRELFHQDEVGSKPEDLLKVEKFSIQ